MPVFEGLMPEPDNSIIRTMLFDLNCWLAFAKLRLHTEETLQLFEQAITNLGNSVRHFQKTTCTRYVTTELPQELAARGRREARLATAQQEVPTAVAAAIPSTVEAPARDVRSPASVSLDPNMPSIEISDAGLESVDTNLHPSETASVSRKGAKGATKSSKKAKLAAKPRRAPKIKTLNLSTYKWHALRDYPNTIRQYGTTDNFSTKDVCKNSHLVCSFINIGLV